MTHATPLLVNVRNIRRRQRVLGISDRALQRALGPGGVNIHWLLRNRSDHLITLGGLSRIADTLGLPLKSLILDDNARWDPDGSDETATRAHVEPSPPSGPSVKRTTVAQDAATLGAALMTRRTATVTTVPQLLDALSWTPTRFRRAEAALRVALDGSGLAVSRHDGRIRLIGADLGEEVTQRLSGLTANRGTGLLPSTTKVLIHLLERPERPRRNQLEFRRSDIGELTNLGLLDPASGGLTADAKTALLLEEIPDVPSVKLKAEWPGRRTQAPKRSRGNSRAAD